MKASRPRAIPFPRWKYFPVTDEPAAWAVDLLEVVRAARPSIDTASIGPGLTSDTVLAFLRPGLEGLGYTVESGKLASQKIKRPVLFGSEGTWVVEYEVDAVHDGLGVVVEVEAGRGARSNAVYRDLIRASLIVNADYLALGVMDTYRHQSGGREIVVESYDAAERQLDAIYASGRLRLPFKGLLLFGY